MIYQAQRGALRQTMRVSIETHRSPLPTNRPELEGTGISVDAYKSDSLSGRRTMSTPVRFQCAPPDFERTNGIARTMAKVELQFDIVRRTISHRH